MASFLPTSVPAPEYYNKIKVEMFAKFRERGRQEVVFTANKVAMKKSYLHNKQKSANVSQPLFTAVHLPPKLRILRTFFTSK